MSIKTIATLIIALMLLLGCTNKNSIADPIDFESNDFDFTNLQAEVQSLDEVFLLEDALYRANQIGDSLNSFKILTEKTKGKISNKELEEIRNTDWETQYLGFPNWSSTVVGTLIKQDFQIKKLELEKAIRLFDLGEIGYDDLEFRKTEFLNSKEKFQQYLASYRIAD